ncbi:hypothetical protein [Pseudogemmobacter sp. W21_MBD1_M6]|uniref:hypothetical protein n=1 Tax=Pseudogemmobacter sp. W21_MBD1_M6 TaxID=3240271 RepID=UPI003F9A650F
MTQTKKLYAEAVGKIINRHDREHVGYLYEWNNGELQQAWFDLPRTDVVIERFKVDISEVKQAAQAEERQLEQSLERQANWIVA